MTHPESAPANAAGATDINPPKDEATLFTSAGNDSTTEDETTVGGAPPAAASLQPIPTNEQGHQYRGAGTPEDPFIVEFFAGDKANPQNFPVARKWFYVAITTCSVLAVTMISAAYTGGAKEIEAEFNLTGPDSPYDNGREIFAAGVALYVLGFALGPSLWGPLSELYGRRLWFIVTHAGATAFTGASAGAPNIASLLVFRFLTGVMGASPLTNSGGIIADLFPSSQRGRALSFFSAAPFIGPTVGPIIGGFVSETVGWRWAQGVMAIFIGIMGIIGTCFLPETYAPVLLSRKAAQLARDDASGRSYMSVIEKDRGATSFMTVFSTALKRPWALLFLEPIILVAASYLSILYATIYMFLGAFPIVYQETRGWSEGIGGLAFLGMTVGMFFGVAYLIWDDNRYQRNAAQGPQQPEARLPATCVGAVVIPIGMFTFAWTTFPYIHWSASIILSSLFGFGTTLVFVGVLNFIIDAYVVYAASALAAAAMERAFFGAAFPLFTTQMYEGCGVQWASSIPAFLTLICVPFPFLMVKYGPAIRMKCKYAKEAAMILAKLQQASEK